MLNLQNIEVEELLGHHGRVKILAMTENTNLLYPSANDKTIRARNLKEKRQTFVFRLPHRDVTSMSITSKGKCRVSVINMHAYVWKTITNW